MPSVPVLEAPQVEQQPLPGRAFPRLSENVPDAAFGESIAQGIDTAGQAAYQEQHREKTQQDQLRTLDAATQLRAGSNTMMYGQNGQGGAFGLHGLDAIDLPNKLLPQYDAMAVKIGSTLTPDQQRMFQAHVLEGRGEMQIQLERHEYQEGNRLQDTILKNSVTHTIDSAALGWRDPNFIERSKTDLKGIVGMQADREGWTPEIRDQAYKDLVGKMHEGVITNMIAGGELNAARDYLFKNYAEMDPKESEAAHRMIHAEQQQQQQQADKAREQRADATMKTALGLESQGKLSSAWVFSHSTDLKAHELNFLLQQASGKGAETNPPVYAGLLTRMTQGQDVRDEANAALAHHDLSLSDYTKLIEGSGKDRPNSVKVGSEYIERALQVDLLNPDPAKATAKANALADFEAWTRDNPQATAEASTREAKAITGRYLIVPPETTTLQMAVPRYLVGSRVKPDLDKTEAATMNAFREGKIGPAELTRQALLMKQWRAAMTAQDQAAGGSK